MTLAAVLDRSRVERESWKYTDVKKLLEPSRIEKFSFVKTAPVQQTNILTFIDGVWNKAQSHLSDLLPNILQGDAASGYRLTLAGQTCLVTSPVALRFVTTEKAPVERATKLHIELGANGRLTLIEHHEASAHATAHVIDTVIDLHPQAKFVHGKIVESSAAAHIATTTVTVAAGGYYDNFALIKGGRLTRNEIDVRLNGNLAQCALNGVMLLRNSEHADTTTRITHAAPHGTSSQMYKSVVADKARGVFQGKIVVAKDAQKTDGQQISRALLLSDQAEMDAKPELEIYADDVKCSHGSTVGDLDADAMFYLRARGLGEAEARSILIHAFVGEIIDNIGVPEWRDFCRLSVEGWLHEQA